MASCSELSDQHAVFVIALGRTGSSHLLRLLNAIPGYRISGETDNSWLYLARHARSLPRGLLQLSHRPVCDEFAPYLSHSAKIRAQNLSGLCRDCNRGPSHCVRQGPTRELGYMARRASLCRRARAARTAHRACANATAATCLANATALACPLACGTCRAAASSPYDDEARSCAARRLFLAAHNPPPRASVFGFKEIYSPWIRRGDGGGALDEVLDGGVDFLRGLWPKAKFIFHARRNLTRVAASDFWRDADACDAACARRFERVVARYRAYAWRNPQHAVFTTIEGLTSPPRSWRETSRSCALRLVQSAGGTPRNDSGDATDCVEADLGRLFRWLGEELTPSLRSTAISHLHLRDWSEETHARRVRVELPNGTVVYETRAYAFATSEQLTPEFQQEKEKERLEKAQRLAAAHRAAKKARRAARLPE